jgi:hypothetical protein
MKRKTLFLLLALTTISASAKPVLHLDPEMTGAEYRRIFKELEKNEPGFRARIAADKLVEVLELGKRNLDWIEVINSKRDEQHKLHLTSPETTAAYPIESPGVSNRNIILANLETLQQSMPREMGSVIFGSGALPETAPIDDKTFVENAYKLNRIYESACRWLLQEGHLEWYKRMARKDIRGYYFLNKETDLKDKLTHWSSLDDATQKKYSEWLINECNNTVVDVESCEAGLHEAIADKQVLHYHERYEPGSKKLFNSYFELVNPRHEIIWNHKNPNIMTMPFAIPDLIDVQDWFKANVEDEYRLNNWSLQIDYSYRIDLAKAKVVFEPGVTPHVEGIGSEANVIYMDENRNIQDYDVKWTIRHEFGHILGLPDCYVEFYDAKKAVMIDYQIDITNLMCSRRGHLQAKHYEELKKNYYKS